MSNVWCQIVRVPNCPSSKLSDNLFLCFFLLWINVKETWLNWLWHKFRCIFWRWGLVKILSSEPGSFVRFAIFLIKIFNFHLFCLHFHQLEEFWKLDGAVAININLHFMMIFLMLRSGCLIYLTVHLKLCWRYRSKVTLHGTFINHQLTKIRHQESIKSIAIVTWPQESCLGVRPLLDFVPSPSSPQVVPCGRWLHSYPREIITFQPTDTKNINHCIVRFIPIVMSIVLIILTIHHHDRQSESVNRSFLLFDHHHQLAKWECKSKLTVSNSSKASLNSASFSWFMSEESPIAPALKLDFHF